MAVPASARVLDGRGRFVIPGLWDMHAHLFFQLDPVREELPLFTAHGVTGIRVMNTPMLTGALDRHAYPRRGRALARCLLES